ncbi:MAG TPA: hypothetical protein ENI23_17615, partial [bacterium]|nr:hypothetical protein [bacterium]
MKGLVDSDSRDPILAHILADFDRSDLDETANKILVRIMHSMASNSVLCYREEQDGQVALDYLCGKLSDKVRIETIDFKEIPPIGSPQNVTQTVEQFVRERFIDRDEPDVPILLVLKGLDEYIVVLDEEDTGRRQRLDAKNFLDELERDSKIVTVCKQLKVSMVTVLPIEALANIIAERVVGSIRGPSHV